MDEAVLAMLQEHLGGFITGYLLVAEYVTDEGGRMVTWETGPDQSLVQSLGLVQWLEAAVQRELIQHMAEEKDDGE